MNLLDTLDALGRRIKNWCPEINEGGCCVYASLVGKELKARGIKPRIIVASYDVNTDIDGARDYIDDPYNKNSWNSAGIWFSHVGIEFQYEGEWYHYDTSGVKQKGHTLDGMSIYPGRLTLAEATALGNEDEGWNHCFDRSRIPSLERRIRSFISAHIPYEKKLKPKRIAA